MIDGIRGHKIVQTSVLRQRLDDINATKMTIEFNLTVTAKRETTTAKVACATPSLAHDLKTSLDDGDLADAVLRTDCGATFRAHKLILSLRSPVFRAMFTGAGASMREGGGEVQVQDVSAEAVKALLEYIYSDSIPSDITLDRAIELLGLAEQYALKLLKQSVCATISAHLSIETVCTLLKAATCYGLRELKDTCIKMIRAHVGAVVGTEGWAEINNDKMVMAALFDTQEAPSEAPRKRARKT